MSQKGEIHMVLGDVAVAFGLLVAVSVALSLNPRVQQKFAAWARARRDAQEKQFWAKRDISDKRQAEAQTRVAEERARRTDAREARIAALDEANPLEKNP